MRDVAPFRHVSNFFFYGYRGPRNLGACSIGGFPGGSSFRSVAIGIASSHIEVRDEFREAIEKQVWRVLREAMAP